MLEQAYTCSEFWSYRYKFGDKNHALKWSYMLDKHGTYKILEYVYLFQIIYLHNNL